MNDSRDLASRLGIPDWEFRIVPGRTRIDYDAHKESKNRRDHKYSLESAAYLLSRALFSREIITSDGFVEEDEVRHMHLVRDGDARVLMVVTTMRPDETVRVMSVRQTSLKERELFLTARAS